MTFRQGKREIAIPAGAPGPRELNMDGQVHFEGECCGEDEIMGRVCTNRAGHDECGARVHQQPVYGGIADACERCDRDDWEPSGTYQVDELGFVIVGGRLS